MRFDVITLFPDMVRAPFRLSLMAKAADAGIFRLEVHDLRLWSDGRHRICDDEPFGGGEGMVMKVGPIDRALQAIRQPEARTRVVMMSPGGQTFNQAHAVRLAQYEQVILLCGHYEGVDERVRLHLVDEELSIGDFVLTGGELAAMVVLEATARVLPGVVGDAASVENESFSSGILDCPHYTRPRSYNGWDVPDILTSGDHARIALWRHQEALRRTLRARPDLLEHVPLTDQEKAMLALFRSDPTIGQDEVLVQTRLKPIKKRRRTFRPPTGGEKSGPSG